MAEEGLVFLFTVKEVFQVSGRGVILAPGVSRSQKPPVNVGDAVTLETPAGMVHRTVIRGMERISSRYAVTPLPDMPVLIGAEVDKGMVPVGTRVLLLPRA